MSEIFNESMSCDESNISSQDHMSSQETIFLEKSDSQTSIWFYFQRASDKSSGKCTLCSSTKIIKTTKGSISGLIGHLMSKHKIDFKSQRGKFSI